VDEKRREWLKNRIRLGAVISVNSCDVAVVEMREDEGGAGDVADLAGAGGDVLEGAPAAGEQR
jgi:hypothetical protein